MDKQLRRKFREYNAKYFGGRLEAVVDWHYEIPGERIGGCHIHGIGKCSEIPESYGKCPGKNLILINTSLWELEQIALFTLLHEMVHLDVAPSNHGPEFQAGMLRLAKLGTFRNLW